MSERKRNVYLGTGRYVRNNRHAFLATAARNMHAAEQRKDFVITTLTATVWASVAMGVATSAAAWLA